MKIDDTDLKILNFLANNSRLSYRQIAKNIGLNVVTVINRMKKLEENNIIIKYGVNVDYEKLGYDLKILIDLRVAKGKLFEVENKIAKHRNVLAVYDVTGNFDVLIVACFKNRKAMDNFIKKIQTYDFVERTETKLVLNTIKENSLLF